MRLSRFVCEISARGRPCGRGGSHYKTMARRALALPLECRMSWTTPLGKAEKLQSTGKQTKAFLHVRLLTTPCRLCGSMAAVWRGPDARRHENQLGRLPHQFCVARREPDSRLRLRHAPRERRCLRAPGVEFGPSRAPSPYCPSRTLARYDVGRLMGWTRRPTPRRWVMSRSIGARRSTKVGDLRGADIAV